MKYEAEFPNSSMLASCSYDDKTQELTVWFRNSKDYTYVDVDKSIFEAMRERKCVSKDFNSIKSTLKQKT